jgi:prevent-host-death family protein
MRDCYSLYQAKAKLSAIVKQVREGRRIIVTLHGEPVAEIRPIHAGAGGIASRFAELVERGIVVPAARKPRLLRPIARRPGALDRFLRDRD